MNAFGIDFYLVGAGNEPKLLDIEHRYIFGRSEQADFVVSDTLSSRQHCALQWDKAAAWQVEDLGSRNGTYVNAHRITALTPLNDRGVVQIGGQQFTLRLLPPGSDTSSLFAAGTLSTQNTFELELREVAAQMSGSTFKGDLLDQGLKQMLRFFALTNKSGRLMLDGDSDKQIWFVQGTPRHACCATVLGLPALKQLASDPGKTFSFHEGEEPEQQSIPGEGNEILIELYGDAEASSGIDAVDLATAERVQKHMLQHIPTVAGYDLAFFYKGFSGVSGDFYDVGHMADGSLLVVLGDVAGHGIQAALVVAGLVKTLRHLRSESRDLLELLTRLNDEVRVDLLPGQFMTMFIGRLRPATGELTIALLGHHQALRISAERPDVVDGVGKTGMALGLASSDIFKRAIKLVDIVLQPGTILLQCTDGLLEAMDSKSTEYGDERWHESARRRASSAVMQDLVDGLAEDVVGFAQTINDDLTVLALRRLSGVPGTEPMPVPKATANNDSTEMISSLHHSRPKTEATSPIPVAPPVAPATEPLAPAAGARQVAVDPVSPPAAIPVPSARIRAAVISASAASSSASSTASADFPAPAPPPTVPHENARKATTVHESKSASTIAPISGSKGSSAIYSAPSTSGSEELILHGFSDEFMRPSLSGFNETAPPPAAKPVVPVAAPPASPASRPIIRPVPAPGKSAPSSDSATIWAGDQPMVPPPAAPPARHANRSPPTAKSTPPSTESATLGAKAQPVAPALPPAPPARPVIRPIPVTPAGKGSPLASESATVWGGDVTDKTEKKTSTDSYLGPAPEMDRVTQPLVRKPGSEDRMLAQALAIANAERHRSDPSISAETPPAGSQSIATDPLVGEVLGQVKLTCCIGEGQMAKVYRGRHIVLDHDVAVKVMRLNNVTTDEHRRKRFMREARLASKISHQNVVQVLDAGLTSDGNTYLVMPLIEGGDLGQRVRNGSRIPPGEFIYIAAAIARGLAAIHLAGAVHRDLKPANILLDMSGEPKIADFGMAQVVEDVALTKLTKAGFILGTPSYMAPECLNSGEQIDSKADIYSFGVTMYHLLAGRLPCEGATAYEVMQAHSRGDYLPLTTAVPQIGDRLAEIVHGCLDRNPHARPKAEELVKILEAIAFAQPNSPAAGPQHVEVADWARRIKKGRRAHGAGMGLLMVVAAVVLLTLLVVLCIKLVG